MWKTTWLLLSAVCFSAISAGGQGSCPHEGRRPGDYSQLSVELCFQEWRRNERRHLEVPAPDHSVVLTVDGESGQLYRDRQPLGRPFTIASYVDWLWSPDSRAMIVTT